MKKEYCHICKDGGKECVDVDIKGRVYLEMFNVRCTKCESTILDIRLKICVNCGEELPREMWSFV